MTFIIRGFSIGTNTWINPVPGWIHIDQWVVSAVAVSIERLGIKGIGDSGIRAYESADYGS